MLSQYYAIREKRLSLQKQADELEQQEKDIIYEMTKGFNTLNEKYSGQVDGFIYNAKRKEVIQAEDWPAISKFILETGAVDMLQKRLTESAVKARLDAGVDVPGIKKSFKWDVKVTKVLES